MAVRKKLLKDWGLYKAGDWASVTDKKYEELVTLGIMPGPDEEPQQLQNDEEDCTGCGS